MSDDSTPVEGESPSDAGGLTPDEGGPSREASEPAAGESTASDPTASEPAASEPAASEPAASESTSSESSSVLDLPDARTFVAYVLVPALVGTAVYWLITDASSLETGIFGIVMVVMILAMDFLFDTIPAE